MTTTNEPASTDIGVEAHLAKHGKVSYLEMPATDPARSAAFYEKVFGWPLHGDGAGRSFSDVEGGLIGHWVTGRAISSEPGIVPYIYVDHIDATFEQIGANGGEIIKPPYPEGNLWVATFRDPAGNLIGIWQAGPR